MATPETLRFDELLAPIAEGAPSGASLRTDTTPGSLYYRIKDARNAARAAERSAMQLGDLEGAQQADWSPVLELAPQILAQKSKDLEIAAWYIEALTRKHGFAGLRDGFHLAREMCERYWDSLHPQPDEDGVSTRVAPLAGLNGDEAEGTLIVPIGMLSITAHTEHGEFSAWHFAQAGELARIADVAQREQRVAAGAVGMERVQNAANATSAEFFNNLLEDLGQCQSEFAALGRVLDERAGPAAPPASNINAALTRVIDAVRFLAQGVLGAQAADTAAPGSSEAGSGGAKRGGPVQSRDEALATLKQIAEYFKRTEPHSPIAYAVERAVRWGTMPLPALVEELIPDMGARSEFQRFTGIQPPSSS